MDHTYNKRSQVCWHQYPYTEKQKREPIPIIENRNTKPSFKTKPKRKLIIGPVPLFKTESESDTNASPTHSTYIHIVLTRKVSHDPIFSV